MKPTGRPGRVFLWLAFIAGSSAIAYIVFTTWGLVGSAVLIALWGIALWGFSLGRRRAQRRIRDMVARLPGHLRAAAIASLSESERAEVLEALACAQKRNDRPTRRSPR